MSDDNKERKLDIPVIIRGTTCYPHFSRYVMTRNLAIVLRDASGQIHAKATVNHPDFPMGNTHVLVRDWEENKDLPALLQKAGIFGELTYPDDCPYSVCQVLKKPDGF